MSRPESLNDELFQPLPADMAERISGGQATAAEPAATWQRYVDVWPDGRITYSYVQVD